MYKVVYFAFHSRRMGPATNHVLKACQSSVVRKVYKSTIEPPMLLLEIRTGILANTFVDDSYQRLHDRLAWNGATPSQLQAQLEEE